ncbi:MAG: CpaF family protein [Acidimicrobiales bacterium]
MTGTGTGAGVVPDGGIRTGTRAGSGPARSLEALADEIHADLLARWGDDADLPGSVADVVAPMVRATAPLLGNDQVDAVVATVRARLEGLGPLDPLLADPTVSEVMVNGGGSVWVERRGAIEAVGVSVPEDTVLRLIERIVSPLGLRIDRSSPMVDARLPDGSRVNAVVRPLAIDGPCLTIRRFAATQLPLSAFCAPEVVRVLRDAVLDRRNVVVSGGTGAGKTTLLNALAGVVPGGERVVTIEDAAELRLPGAHVVRLEARPPNAEGAGAVTIRDLVRNALRMRPDRIVVGEVRGPEALDMVQAMNTGHDGALSTCHANGPLDALRRLETLCLLAGAELPLVAVREQLSSSVDLVVQVSRGADGRRRVTGVAEPGLDAAGGGWECHPVVRGEHVVDAPRRPPRVARCPDAALEVDAGGVAPAVDAGGAVPAVGVRCVAPAAADGCAPGAGS